MTEEGESSKRRVANPKFDLVGGVSPSVWSQFHENVPNNAEKRRLLAMFIRYYNKQQEYRGKHDPPHVVEDFWRTAHEYNDLCLAFGDLAQAIADDQARNRDAMARIDAEMKRFVSDLEEKSFKASIRCTCDTLQALEARVKSLEIMLKEDD